MKRLNVGCGPVQPEGWTNIDGSRRARLAAWAPWIDRALVRLGVLPPTEFGPTVEVRDVRRGLGLEEGGASTIYSGEFLEHLKRDEGARFLAECHRVLAPGGVLRVRVPDNYRFWRNYVREYEANLARPRAEWSDAPSRWVEMFFRDICVERRLLASMGHFHKWLYDEVSLIRAFEQAGFVEVERRSLHDSRIPDVAAVETRDDLIVEGVKPPARAQPQRAA